MSDTDLDNGDNDSKDKSSPIVNFREPSEQKEELHNFSLVQQQNFLTEEDQKAMNSGTKTERQLCVVRLAKQNKISTDEAFSRIREAHTNWTPNNCLDPETMLALQLVSCHKREKEREIEFSSDKKPLFEQLKIYFPFYRNRFCERKNRKNQMQRHKEGKKETRT